MKVTVNAEPRSVADGATITDLVVDLGWDPSRPGAAVVRNGEVVPQRRWPEVALADGDTVEVVTASQGG